MTLKEKSTVVCESAFNYVVLLTRTHAKSTKNTELIVSYVYSFISPGYTTAFSRIRFLPCR